MKQVPFVLLAVGMVATVFGNNQAMAKPIKVCTDENFWYPFTYEEGRVSKGIHIDMARAALTKLGYTPEFEPQPWLRCLDDSAANGKVEAVVTASFKPDRALTMYYPDDASKESKPCASSFKLMCVSYVALMMTKQNDTFTGDFKTLPQPVRAPLGYSIVKDIEQSGLKVDQSKGDIPNMKKLMRDKNGVVVLTSAQAKNFLNDPQYSSSLKLAGKPLSEKSYYLTFSKKGTLSETERKAIWNEISKLRDDESFMKKLYSNY